MKLRENIAISENGFVFDSGNGESFSVNSTGADILNWLKLFHNQNEIKSKLIEKYDIDEVTAEKDIFDFIAILKQYDFIKNE